VFLDETGHEGMPQGHAYYGMSGCAVMAADYERLIARPWRDFRRLVTGNPDAPLHAFNFGRAATPERLEACGRFFRDNGFMRIGSVAATTTQIPRDQSYKQDFSAIPEAEHLAWMVLRALHNRILVIAKWTPFRSVAIVVERNPRSKRLLQSAFADLGFEEDGKPVPVDLYEMDKKAAEPGLEVADFVANAIAGHARHTLVGGKEGCRRDFQAIFQSVDPKLASFLAITGVEVTPAQRA